MTPTMVSRRFCHVELKSTRFGFSDIFFQVFLLCWTELDVVDDDDEDEDEDRDRWAGSGSGW